ncbi:hypothetical protein [uncultured Pseudodesulfovibrio sp.]|nr:hypothetical protein [uncultured Pseudodesulfovibrio sp.]
MFKKFVYICLWLCVLSGTASTAMPPSAAQGLVAQSSPSTLTP